MKMLLQKERTELRLASLLVVFAIVLGGGGSPSPAPELALQLISVALAGLWVLQCPDSVGKVDRSIALACLMILILPILQIVPLPPELWQALPNRQTQMDILAFVDAQDSWQPISIAPQRTIASLVSLGPPIIAIMLISRLSARERHVLIALVGAAAFVSVLLGAVQVMSNGSVGHFYDQTHRGVVTGYHANRNAAGDLLLIGVIASPLLVRFAPDQSEKSIFLLLISILSIGVLLTQSRTGIAILPFAILAAIILDQMMERGRVAWRSILIWGAGGVGLVAAMVTALLYSGQSRLSDVLSRFSARSDFRVELWQDGWFAATQYWPFGSGVGTIQPVLIAAERLEVVDTSMPNRVHNDYLEFLVEAGIFAPILGCALVIIGVKLAAKSLGKGGTSKIVSLFAIFALLILAIHSIMDYPLRNMALATLAAMAFGLLCPSVQRLRSEGASNDKGRF